MARIEVYLDARPNYESLRKHPEFRKHHKEDWAWHRNVPNTKNPLAMKQMDPIWEYYLYDHEGQFSRCIFGSCKMCIRSCAPEILQIHRDQSHLPALEHCNLVKLRKKLRNEKYCELNKRAFEELEKEVKESKLFIKKELPKNAQSRLKFQQMTDVQLLEFASATKAKIKDWLKKITKFTLLVDLLPSDNSITIFISVGVYSFKLHKFCIIHLNVEPVDTNSDDLPGQIETAVTKVLSDFDLHFDNVKQTFVEGPPDINTLRSKLRFQRTRISYRQKLIEFSTKLNKIEPPDKSEEIEIDKIKKLVDTEIDSAQGNAMTIDFVIPFISKLQRESENVPWLSTLIFDIFGFAIDPKNNDFCSDYMTAVFLNPKLAIDLNDSCLKVAEAVLKSKHKIFTQNAKASQEFSTWIELFKVASFSGLNSLLSGSQLTEDNFNPAKFWNMKKSGSPNLSRIAIDLLVTPAFLFNSKSAVEEWPEGLTQSGNFDALKLQSMIAYNERFWPKF